MEPDEQRQWERMRDRVREQRITYQVFPVLTGEENGERFDWLEIALHTEHGCGRDCLEELAEFVERRQETPLGCRWQRSPFYVTLASAEGSTEMPGSRLLHTLSLVATDVEPYGWGEEPTLLTQTRKRLEELDVVPVKSTGGHRGTISGTALGTT